ncbi:MAG: HAD hydrolase-like protein [Myxococcales bacterium]|nr:HAD hydrolase-like protein [Myxococcales bacterium]
MQPRLLVFDLDGTLLDTLADITVLLGRALVAHGRPALPAAVVRGYLGDGARTLVAKAVAEADEALLDRVLARYRAEYEADPTPATRIMPHVEALLAWLPTVGIRAAVCTNKPAAVARAVVSRSLPDVFVCVVGQGDAPRIKPAPDLLERALALADTPASEAWMIGDGPQDVLAARAVGVFSVAVANGYGHPAEVVAARPDLSIADLGELRRWLSSAPAGSR